MPAWTTSSVSTSEVVALTTAALVAWNTWRQSKMAKVVQDVHTLTNSAMGKQLLDKVEMMQQQSVLAHRFAALTKSEADIAAAQAIDIRVASLKAEYEQHQKNQAKVDAQ